MASILKVRDADGTVHEIYALQGKSAYAYAVEGGYTGTEAEFAAKLAQEKFANPNALTFTGAVTGSYDGSEPITVEIPGGGEGGSGAKIVAYTLDGKSTTEIQLASGMQFIAYGGETGTLEFAFTNSSTVYTYNATSSNSLWGIWIETSSTAGSFIPSGGAKRTYIEFGNDRNVCTVKNNMLSKAIVITIG